MQTPSGTASMLGLNPTIDGPTTSILNSTVVEGGSQANSQTPNLSVITPHAEIDVTIIETPSSPGGVEQADDPPAPNTISSTSPTKTATSLDKQKSQWPCTHCGHVFHRSV